MEEIKLVYIRTVLDIITLLSTLLTYVTIYYNAEILSYIISIQTTLTITTIISICAEIIYIVITKKMQMIVILLIVYIIVLSWANILLMDFYIYNDK